MVFVFHSVLQRLIMRVWIAAALLIFLVLPSTGNTQKYDPQKDQNHASQIPPGSINVTVSQPASDPQRDKPENYAHDPYEWFWPPVWSNWVLAAIAGITAFFAIRNLRAIESQVDEMRKTGEQTDKLIRENIAQSSAMAESAKETARFAAAMEGVAESLTVTASASVQAASASQQSIIALRQQMRAWLTVTIGDAAPQDRTKDQRFAAAPVIVNSGLTPARNVQYRINSAILPKPLPLNFGFPLPEQGVNPGGNCIGAHQNAQMGTSVDGFSPDQDVPDIMAGKIGFYVWGLVTYDDVLGGPSHSTKFFQQITWRPDGQVYGFYPPGYNDQD
jgi:hypothetical protein